MNWQSNPPLRANSYCSRSKFNRSIYGGARPRSKATATYYCGDAGDLSTGRESMRVGRARSVRRGVGPGQSWQERVGKTAAARPRPCVPPPHRLGGRAKVSERSEHGIPRLHRVRFHRVRRHRRGAGVRRRAAAPRLLRNPARDDRYLHPPHPPHPAEYPHRLLGDGHRHRRRNGDRARPARRHRRDPQEPDARASRRRRCAR